MKFAELTQVALLGTERQAISIPASASALGKLQAQVDVNQRERALLSLAALSSLHEHIGSLPARDHSPLPQPSPAEQQRRASERAGSFLLRLLGGEFVELLPEWLALAVQHRVIAPPEALPSLLGAGASTPEQREAILPVLGERGRWLAAPNEEWAWVAGAANEDESIWQVGEQAARLLFFERLRKTNPARARELLMGTWKEETPEDRAAFVVALRDELGPEDEPFLEGALDDKRKEVRRHATAWLARLPDSALSRRMTERLKPLIKFVPGAGGSVLKLKKSKPAVIEVTLPGECDKAMQRDGIELKPAQGFGEKAWWLIQMLELAPLDLWTREWNSTPVEILAASQQGEWKNEFFEAWTRAAILKKNAMWADALFDVALAAQQLERFANLLTVLSAVQRETRLKALLSDKDKKISALRGALLAQCRHDWSPEFSRAVLALMRDEAGQKSGDWPLRNQFKDFAVQLAPDVLRESAIGWPTESEAWQFWSKGVDEFLSVTQFRADLRAAFTDSTTNS